MERSGAHCLLLVSIISILVCSNSTTTVQLTATTHPTTTQSTTTDMTTSQQTISKLPTSQQKSTKLITSQSTNSQPISGDEATPAGEGPTVCYPNATVVVENPDASKYVSAKAVTLGTGGGHQCDTAWIPGGDGVGKAFLKITGCELNVAILVSFSSREQDDYIYGGEHVFFSVIRCNDIGMAGVTGTVTVKGFVAAENDNIQASDPGVTDVSYTSSLRQGSVVGNVSTSAIAGSELYWTIDISGDHIALPTSCTAYAGNSTLGTLSTNIISNGCSENHNLLEDFSASRVLTIPPDVLRYWTRVWTFKFYEAEQAEYVLLHCDLCICPPECHHCALNACPSRKRRVSDPAEEDADIMYVTTDNLLKVIVVTTPDYLEADSASRCTPKTVWVLDVLLLLVHVLKKTESK